MMNGMPMFNPMMGQPPAMNNSNFMMSPMMNQQPSIGNPNFMNQIQQFSNNFQQMYPNMDPRMKVQELINTGQMSQQQYNMFRQMVNSITGMNL